MKQNTKPILELKNISKTFPGVKALDKVNLVLYPGEVLALCGENGAGKSTLMKYITAIHAADSDESEMHYLGERVHFKCPQETKEAGIVLVFQELSLVNDLNVAENIFLGSLPKTKLGLVDKKALHKNTQELLNCIDFPLPSDYPVSGLTISQQQMVEIARALAYDAKVVILDEPTSSLTDKEKEILFRNIQRIKEQGVSIIYITHKMDEVFEISDRITVFRDGKNTDTLVTKEVDINDVVQLMIGRTLDEFFHKSNAEQSDEEVIRVNNLTQAGSFSDISFSIHKGEILGLYGLVGAGRSEIAETIFGVRHYERGEIYIEGTQVKINNSMEAVSQGIALVPEDRKVQGIVLRMSCMHNISLPKLDKFRKGFFLDKLPEVELFNNYKKQLSISCTGPDQRCINLSGGNQQKVILAKWLALEPKLLILDEPTRGIDVGAKAEIHKLIALLAEQGMAVLVISSEMPEIMGISSRIITIADGEMKGEFCGDDITEENIIKSITVL